jgi:hypothetical protein
VAKKRKGARPAAPRGAKKAVKRTVKKTARRKAVTRRPAAAIEDPYSVDLRDVHTRLDEHITKLSNVKNPQPHVLRALETLKQAQLSLSTECQPTMVINFA